MTDNSKLTGAEFFRKYYDIVNEAAPPPPKPAFAEWMGDAEWAESVQMYGLAGAEKHARTQHPAAKVASNQATSQAQLDFAKTQATAAGYGKGQFTDQDRASALAHNQQLATNKAAIDGVKSVMSKADIYGTSPDQLGQIGQMSSAFQPNQGNFQGQPGQVQLTGNKSPTTNDMMMQQSKARANLAKRGQSLPPVRK